MKKFGALFKLILLAVKVMSVTQAAAPWGTLKPNLYFAVKELS